MKRQDFIQSLRAKFSALPRKEIEDRINFYNEMIDDRIEAGLTEEEAISEIITSENFISQMEERFSTLKISNKATKSTSRWNTWKIVLLVLGSPIWLSLIISCVAIVISLYVSLWAVIASIWAAFAAFAVAAPGGVIGSLTLIFQGSPLAGFAIFGLSLVSAGLAIFSFFGCVAATKGSVILTKKIFSSVKRGS